MTDNNAAPDQTLPKIATLIPPESSFTFSSGGSAPSFDPHDAFYYNTPKEKPEQRNWTYRPAATEPNPTAEEAPATTSAESRERLIAPLRRKQLSEGEREKAREEQARLQAQASKEARNVTRLEKENAFLKEQLKRSYMNIQNHKEEQTTKQRTVDDLKHTIEEVLKSAEHGEHLVAEKENIIRKLREENDTIKKQSLEEKMAEGKKAEELEARIAERNGALEKIKDEVAEMAANQPTTDMEELRGSIKTLENRNEALNAEFDSIRARLEATEKKLTETTVSYRQVQTTVSNSNATIQDLERQLGEGQVEINNLRQEVGNRDNRIRSKDDDLRNTAAEVANLSSLNKQVREQNTRLKSQNGRLELQAKHNNAEIEVLREASRDYLELETALAEAQATTTQLRDEIVSLEQSNAELKARLEEYTPFARTSNIGSNLQSELSESDFQGTEDETLFTLNDRDIGDDFPEATESAEIIAPEESTEYQEVSETSEVTFLLEVVTPQVTTESPEVTQALVVTTSPEVTQSPSVTQSPAVTTPPETTQTNRTNSPPVVILKSHNPLECWLQVYLDLWILFVFWFSHRSTKSFGSRNTVSSSGSVIQDDRAVPIGSLSPLSGDAPLPPVTLRDVASVVTTTASGSMDHAELDQELPDIWITILAFGFHVLFYAVIMVCVSNYRAVLHQRSIWLSANEITRQYLHKFYRVPFERRYGMFHELFGPVRFLEVWRYNIHNWAMINRSFPG
jgi:predicted  nucleic acid-binding Zn-ribbon protein